MRETNSYQTKVKLNQQSLAELKWWRENILLQNGKPLKIGIPQSRTATSSQGNIGLSVSQWNSSYSRVLAKQSDIQEDWQSRNHRDSSDWKLNPKMFSQIMKIRGIPQIDLFASLLNHQLPKYMSWHPDPGS